MDEDAHTWILPHLEGLSSRTIPFASNWQPFEREFIKQWIPLDLTESVQEVLKNLKQGKIPWQSIGPNLISTPVRLVGQMQTINNAFMMD